MPIIAFGLNHRTAGIDLRGRASILPNDLPTALEALKNSASFIREAIILSTCNRTEIHAQVRDISENETRRHMLSWLADLRNLTLSELESSTYCHWEQDAVGHILSVASGLDSQVLGEPQIFGQFKAAFYAANRANSVNTDLTDLVMAAIKTGKRVRSDTEIGQNSISIAQAVVIMARQIFSDLNQTNVLLLGAGETICLVSKHMKSANVRTIAIANRTMANASRVAELVDGEAMALSEFGSRLHEYDIVISSTNSPSSVLSKEVVAHACSQRRFRPMFIVDLAVPRDVEASVSDLSDVYLYTIDNLTSVIDENLKLRTNCLAQAKSIVDEGVQMYEEQHRIRQVSGLVTNFRESVSDMRKQEIDKAHARLRAGEDPHEVIERLGEALAHKFAHNPTVAMRNASKSDDQELLALLSEIFQSK
ncbi:MAG: glutamyl-tRNA reductase [Gammaproteobacteria bacterium]|nr:glutamyl-tRNA reductase [Gammaproteobacteria bacterium]MYD79652.1 glutamyl-tRNA reductase [Gammaproteobacteria bacterium]